MHYHSNTVMFFHSLVFYHVPIKVLFLWKNDTLFLKVCFEVHTRSEMSKDGILWITIGSSNSFINRNRLIFEHVVIWDVHYRVIVDLIKFYGRWSYVLILLESLNSLFRKLWTYLPIVVPLWLKILWLFLYECS